MDSNSVALIANLAAITNLGVDALSLLIDHHDFIGSRVRRLFYGLRDTGINLSAIGDSEELQSYFFTIIQNVSHEANAAKIEYWKDSVIHLATDFKDYDFTDSLIRTLSDLTSFELTVLYKFYSNDFSPEVQLRDKVIESFEILKVPRHHTQQAIKRIAAHGLIEESGSGSRLGTGPTLNYSRNELGPIFLQFINRVYKI